MATKATRLPSGNYRSQVMFKDASGKKRYRSFTASTKTEAEYLAREFELENDKLSDVGNWTIKFAMDQYITEKSPLLSATTITGYKKIRDYAFQDIMNVPLKKVTSDLLQAAVLREMNRPHVSRSKDKEQEAKAQEAKPQEAKPQSAKSIRNSYGFLSAVLRRYLPGKVFRVDLPKSSRKIRSLPEPNEIYNAIRGEKIELACLLAMWLSFSESEIRGLTKSKSLDVDKDGTYYLTIREVVVWADGRYQRKSLAKTDARIRRHKVPEYIKTLIDNVDGDILVPYVPSVLLRNLQRLLRENGLPEITFHDLRHVNVSVMAMLNIPDKYAQERGGFSTDYVMKKVYTETFSQERQRVDAVIDDYFERVVCTNVCTSPSEDA